MLTLSIYLLTAFMVIVCLFLVLLVLVQLPKKEAGMGQAFGGAATDALFGSGSGNVLTKATKWGSGIFFALAIALTVMGTYKTSSGGASRLQKLMSETKPVALPAVAAPAATTPVASNTPVLTPAPLTPKPAPAPAPAK